MSTFPRTRSSRLGYDVGEVETFLNEARRAYDADPGDASALTAEDIRHVSFSMKRGGFSTTHVDAALERLEDAFAFRQRERARDQRGRDAWIDDARTTAQVILNRLDRPSNRIFDRTSILSSGYHRADVDRFASRLAHYFQDGNPMSVDEVRTVAFRQQRGGYREVQVDLLLDSVTDVMLAVR